MPSSPDASTRPFAERAKLSRHNVVPATTGKRADDLPPPIDRTTCRCGCFCLRCMSDPMPPRTPSTGAPASAHSSLSCLERQSRLYFRNTSPLSPKAQEGAHKNTTIRRHVCEGVVDLVGVSVIERARRVALVYPLVREIDGVCVSKLRDALTSARPAGRC